MKDRTVGLIRRRCWALCRKIVILRDSSTCQWCSKIVFGSNCHVSHVVPRSAGLSYYYDPMNLKILCADCHINKWHRHPKIAEEWFKEKFPDRVTYLQEKKRETVKWYTSDWNEIEQGLIRKLKALQSA